MDWQLRSMRRRIMAAWAKLPPELQAAYSSPRLDRVPWLRVAWDWLSERQLVSKIRKNEIDLFSLEDLVELFQFPTLESYQDRIDERSSRIASAAYLEQMENAGDADDPHRGITEYQAEMRRDQVEERETRDSVRGYQDLVQGLAQNWLQHNDAMDLECSKRGLCRIVAMNGWNMAAEVIIQALGDDGISFAMTETGKALTFRRLPEYARMQLPRGDSIAHQGMIWDRRQTAAQIFDQVYREFLT